jgi:hypothetical protein
MTKAEPLEPYLTLKKMIEKMMNREVVKNSKNIGNKIKFN